MGRKKKATSKPTENAETEKKISDLQWTDEMEAALFNAFLDQHNKGKRADLGWKNEAWGPIVEAVQAVYDIHLSILLELEYTLINSSQTSGGASKTPSSSF